MDANQQCDLGGRLGRFYGLNGAWASGLGERTPLSAASARWASGPGPLLSSQHASAATLPCARGRSGPDPNDRGFTVVQFFEANGVPMNRSRIVAVWRPSAYPPRGVLRHACGKSSSVLLTAGSVLDGKTNTGIQVERQLPVMSVLMDQ